MKIINIEVQWKLLKFELISEFSIYSNIFLNLKFKIIYILVT